jgi:hypothetical protein
LTIGANPVWFGLPKNPLGENMSQTRIILDESEIPTHWYNIVPNLKNPPAPPLGPDGQPVSPDKMLAIFPETILEQEMSASRWIPIPEEVRKIYVLWRPSPLCRAERLEKMLGTSAKIQIRGRLGRGFAQAEFRCRANLSEQDRRHQAPGDGNRCRAIGLVAGARWAGVRSAGAHFHGQGQL